MSDYLKRLAEALKKREAPMGPDAWDWQQFADTSPTGSVNAPGGVSQPQERDKPQRLGKLLAGASMLPGPSGDLLGPLSDAYMYATEPESRTPGNFALSALGALPFLPSLATVYHGSPHKFDAFDLSKIGTGEGAQAYGHGLYLADSPEVAKGYATLGHTQGNISTIKGKNILDVYGALDKSAARLPPKVAQTNYDKMALLENLMNNQTPSEVMSYAKENGYSPEVLRWFETDVLPHYQGSGNLYTVDLPDEAIAKMLDWDKPLSQQAPEVQAAFQKLGIDESVFPQWTGQQAYEGEVRALTEFDGVPKGDARKRYSEQLRSLGIPGIRYLDGGSRGAGQGTSNYVVFDDKLPKILKRE